jgi:hypothetical protein
MPIARPCEPLRASATRRLSPQDGHASRYLRVIFVARAAQEAASSRVQSNRVMQTGLDALMHAGNNLQAQIIGPDYRPRFTSVWLTLEESQLVSINDGLGSRVILRKSV